MKEQGHPIPMKNNPENHPLGGAKRHMLDISISAYIMEHPSKNTDRLSTHAVKATTTFRFGALSEI